MLITITIMQVRLLEDFQRMHHFGGFNTGSNTENKYRYHEITIFLHFSIYIINVICIYVKLVDLHL